MLLKDQGYRFSDTLEMQYFLTICKSEEDSKNKVNLKNVEDKYKAVLAICGQNKNTQIIRKVIDNLKATNTYLTPEIVEEFIV
ncbi:MAG: hypothetical protein LBU27_04565 [Candidatus Peribacteria bacterium]|nr:hypothetical protein [Candidatus Peribacteria bacterium]